MAGWSEQTVELGEVKVQFSRGGRGRPVIVPPPPGFGVPERPQWMRHPRDLAALYQWLLADLGIERASLVGLGFGGWIAAEMAGLAPRDFHRLVLVGAMGLK